MKNIIYVFVLFFATGLINLNLSAQETENGSTSDGTCSTLSKLINGFTDGFEGLYEKSTEEMSDGKYIYELSLIPSMFESGNLTFNSSKTATRVFLSSDLISSEESVEAFLESLFKCLANIGFTYNGYEEYEDYYMGSFETEYYYYNSTLEISIVESWMDDAMIFIYIKPNE
ncbi:MAG: hypothetical protein C0592_13490 [Marinilabiliales bacterium]|nr:MAG: hypothetical protein C0592_13490 [Marinilabiliales bacterium]